MGVGSFNSLIKLVFALLTHVSYANMKKMQIIQPKMKAIQEHYKNDPQKQQRELMELYRRNKVNPVMGCLPMLIQIPIFIAMFRLLPEAIELHGAPFVGWITDLSAPDRLITFRASLPLLGWNSLNILPILMALSQLWYQKIMPQQPGASPEQANIMNFMPLFWFHVLQHAIRSHALLDLAKFIFDYSAGFYQPDCDRPASRGPINLALRSGFGSTGFL